MGSGDRRTSRFVVWLCYLAVVRPSESNFPSLGRNSFPYLVKWTSHTDLEQLVGDIHDGIQEVSSVVWILKSKDPRISIPFKNPGQKSQLFVAQG